MKANFETTNAQDWAVTMSVYDDDTEAGFDLDDYTVYVRLNDKNGASLYETTGTKSDDDDAITSIVSWTIPVATMGTLRQGTYGVAVRIVSDDSTRQILLGTLTVGSGGFE
jgi:hypothetical protein